jgi:IPT/TIG domain-containing protein
MMTRTIQRVPILMVLCAAMTGTLFAAAPTITGISPTAQGVGYAVIITGTNFGSTQGPSTVQFNGTTATSITKWSMTSITAVVPTGASTGPVVVTVGGVSSNGVSLTVGGGPRRK